MKKALRQTQGPFGFDKAKATVLEKIIDEFQASAVGSVKAHAKRGQACFATMTSEV